MRNFAEDASEGWPNFIAFFLYLSYCDYFLWSHLKGKVYGDPPHDLQDFKNEMRRDIQNPSIATLRTEYPNLKNRLLFVIREKGELRVPCRLVVKFNKSNTSPNSKYLTIPPSTAYKISF